MKILFYLVPFMFFGCTQGFSPISSSNLNLSGVLQSGTSAQAQVHVVDQNGNSVSGASVSGTWSGIVSGNASAQTDASGNATLISSASTAAGNYQFRVTNISAAGAVYDSTKNKVTQSSITR